ncbi:MAG TPA: hypothetical protein VGR26_15025 [Acidimicrobiales bacterium]|nr:hypothetical protein [Acidimicrobiales bacterium]
MTSATAREVEWFRAEVPGLPPLVDPAGPFYRVTDDLAELAQSRTQLFLALVATLDASASKLGPRRVDHEIAALVMWRVGAAGRAHISHDQLDDAIEAVVARARGVPEHANHGDRWAMVGPVTVEFPAPHQLLSVGDAISAAGASNVRSIRYAVREYV